jgi:hypothetical protein
MIVLAISFVLSLSGQFERDASQVAWLGGSDEPSKKVEDPKKEGPSAAKQPAAKEEKQFVPGRDHCSLAEVSGHRRQVVGENQGGTERSQ